MSMKLDVKIAETGSKLLIFPHPLFLLFFVKCQN